MECFAKGGRGLILLAACNLISLGKRNYKGQLSLLEKADHLQVKLLSFMPDVNKANDQVKAAFLLKVTTDEVCPALFFLVRNSCKSVAGQVYKFDAINVKEVDISGFTWNA